jgi:hypothetical protein
VRAKIVNFFLVIEQGTTQKHLQQLTVVKTQLSSKVQSEASAQPLLLLDSRVCNLVSPSLPFVVASLTIMVRGPEICRGAWSV